MNEAVLNLTADGTILYSNPSFAEILKTPLEKVIGSTMDRFVLPEDLQIYTVLISQSQKGTSKGEVRLKAEDGSIVPVDFSISSLESNDSRRLSAVVIRGRYDKRQNRDVSSILETERKEEEQARQELLRRLIAAQEDERRRISREMHDQCGQQLSALTLKLAALKREHGGHANLGEQLAYLEAIAKRLDADIDSIVWQLRPTALDDLGLAAAFTNHATNWAEDFQIRVKLHVRGIERGDLTDEIDTALYRVLQEALNNIAKHAQAKNVDILLEARADHVSLIVEDDGIGFEGEQAFGSGQKGLGLIGMRERIELFGGTLDIESHSGKGTTVVVRIPAPENAKRKSAT